jgi:preprotein translocase subunit SecY
VVLLQSFKNIFVIPELRKRLLITLAILIIDRVGLLIPIVGVDLFALGNLMKQATQLSGLLNYLDLISGGGLANCTLFALGIGPYISASIMMQLLGMAIPSFEALLKEGEYGRKMINQYTRYLTLGLALFWSSIYSITLERQNLVLTPGWSFRIVFVISLTVGSLFVMWLGEQISLFGIGNGSSMIIFAGIVARFPSYFVSTLKYIELGNLTGLIAFVVLAIFILVAAGIVFLEKGERKIPVQYARRVVGNRMYAGQSTYIPFKVNTASVMPVIFANSVLLIPMQLIQLFSDKLEFLSVFSDPKSAVHNIITTALIVFFSYFYTAIIFNPEELAENMKKGGGFIPGYRPGRKTAEYFAYILNRIGLVGALYLAALALFPNILSIFVNMPFALGGTSLLICVGTALDTSAQMESYLIERRYEGFLSSGDRLKGRGRIAR